jgi:Secretion system C-terminal sorting domain
MKKFYLPLIMSMMLSVQCFGHVNLLTPVGGETYNVGDTVTLRWQIAISHNLLNWDLFFSEDGGVSWDTIQVNIPSTGNSVGTLVEYDWVVPNKATSTAKIWIYMDNSGTDYDDKSGNFTINIPVGLSAYSEKGNFNLYPNPLQKGNNVNLSVSDNPHEISTIEVMDLSGKSLLVRYMNLPAGTLKSEIDLDGLKSGHYMLLIKDNQNVIISKRPFVIL